MYRYSSTSDVTEAQAIIVLGAAQYDGEPSPILKARLDHAYDLFIQKKAPLIITTGGNTAGDRYTEGGAGKRYLAARGILPSAVIAEEHSLNTLQNIMRVKEISEPLGITKIIIVSDGFHLFRASIIAGSFGFDSQTSATPKTAITNSETIFRYMLRETGSVMLFSLFGV